MTCRVYYSEWDAFAAAWLHELMKDGQLPKGEIDTRDLATVPASDLKDFDQVHLCAGIGGWAYALRLASWGDRPVWSGSFPCQPFSAAGKQQGTADKRHLWPVGRELIRACRPAVVFGEQVASALGRDWWSAGVRPDLEGMAYFTWAVDTCAAGVGAPHIRQRLYWLADTCGSRARRDTRAASGAQARSGGARCTDGIDGGHAPVAGGPIRGLADADRERLGGFDAHLRQASGRRDATAYLETAGCGEAGIGLGDTHHQRPQGRIVRGNSTDQRLVGPTGLDGFWSRAEWLACSDGKARRVEPGIFPLADGVHNRVGTLRGAGNAIVPQVAAQFIGAYLDDCP